MAVWNLFFLTILLPLVVIVMLFVRSRRPVSGWIATLLLAAGITGFSVLAAPWGWFGIPFRFVIAGLFLGALLISARRPPPEELSGDSPLRIMVKVLIAFFFGGVAVGVLLSHRVPAGSIDLAFPLRNGTYLVAHGGSEPASNLHARHPQQRYGLDIVKLNSAGMRARGLYPENLDRYAIYGVEIFSPCDGIVVSALNTFPDNRPGNVDPKNPPGNHVVVRCGGEDVILAHMKEGSVAVLPKAKVATGTVLGRVGNSGNTTEPHLHVHAERDGKGVPARFDGKWLVRNAVVRK